MCMCRFVRVCLHALNEVVLEEKKQNGYKFLIVCVYMHVHTQDTESLLGDVYAFFVWE